MIALILIKTLSHDINKYNKVATDEEKAEEKEETGMSRCLSVIMCVWFN